MQGQKCRKGDLIVHQSLHKRCVNHHEFCPEFSSSSTTGFIGFGVASSHAARYDRCIVSMMTINEKGQSEIQVRWWSEQRILGLTGIRCSGLAWRQ